MVEFELCVKTESYRISYSNNSSLKVDTKTNTWKVESLELTVVFSRNKTKYLGIGAAYLKEVEKKSQSYFFIYFQASRTVQNKQHPG